jgi:uncharacterized protein (TIGR02246 family)
MRASPEVEREVGAVLQEWVAAYGRKDADAYVGLFSDEDDVVVFGTGVDEVRVGRREIAEQARRDFEQSDQLAARLGDVRVSVAGEVAWATMSSAAVEASVAGQDESFPLRITAVLELRDDRWVIQHAHFSAPTFTQEPGHSFPARERAR